MEKDWITVCNATSGFQASLIQGMLKEHDIESVIMNRRDSAYVMLGAVEVYVRKEDFEKASLLVEEAER